MEKNKQDKIIVIPMDYKIPLIRIKTKQITELINNRIVVRIDNWDINSMYPNGHYIQQLGVIGNTDTEINALLVDNNITINPFSATMMSEIPQTSKEEPWKIPIDEISKRRDMRDERIFSIDPLGSLDIDDALSVKVLPNGNYGNFI